MSNKSTKMKNIDAHKKLLAASLLSVVLLTCELAKLDRSSNALRCATGSTNEQIENQGNFNPATTTTERGKFWKDHTHHLGKVCQTSWFPYLVKILWSLLQDRNQQAKGRKQKKRN